MKRHRYAQSVLLAVLIASAVSCAADTPTVDPTGTQANTESTVAAEKEVPTDPIPQSLPDITFDGAAFRFIKWSESSAYDLTEFATDGLNGELLNDEVYKRNQILESRYDVVISSENHAQPIQQIRKLVTAGDTTYQVVTDWPSRMASAASSGVLYDMNEVPYLDFDAVWWDHNAAESYTILGKKYFTTGDVLLFDKQRVFCVIVNRTLADMLQIDNIYDTVRSGKWTIDLFNTYCEMAVSDLDGDGKLGGINDRFGLISGSNTCTPYLLFGMDNSYSELDKDGNPVPAIANEHMINSIEKLGETIFDETVTIHNEQIYTTIGINDRELFQQRRGLFNTTVTHILRLMDMDDNYGVIPQPKYDEAQENYISAGSGDWSAALGIPSSLDEVQLEMTGILLEAMAALSHETTYPAFVEDILMAKKAPDADSVEMLRLIYSNIQYDLYDVFKVGSIDQVMLKALNDQKGKNVMSLFESNSDKFTKSYDKLLEKFRDLE